MFDFECPQGHHTEHFLPKFTERVQCGHNPTGQYACTEEGEYRPSFWYSSSVQTAQRFSPVVIHRDEHGNVRFPGNANAPVPEGFQKVELATIHDVRKFEAEINKQDTIKSEKFREARAKFLDGQLKANREAVDEIIRGGTWQGTDEHGRPVERRGISPRGMKILEQLRAASRLKQERGRSQTNPEFFIEAFSKDASNREHHRDASTNWQRVRK
jgi:hypothetical protein